MGFDAEICFEDLAVGQRFDCGESGVSAEEITDFAKRYDPQAFHLDEAAAKRSLLGGLAASGWHVTGLMMRMFCDSVLRRAAGAGSPGAEEVAWRAPLRPQAPVSLTVEVVSARPSTSRPWLGVVGFAAVLSGDAGVICRQRFTGLIGRRGMAPPRRMGLARSFPATPTAHIEWGSPDSTVAWGAPEAIVFDRPIALGPVKFTEAEIIGFAQAFDPQPFHLDRAAAEQSVFGGLAASGWHVAACWMQRFVAAKQRVLDAIPAAERAAAEERWGPSPGIADLAWRRPVMLGDVLQYFTTPKSLRPLRSKPGWALLSSDNFAVNQRGETPLRFTGRVLVRTAEAQAKAMSG